MIDFLGRPDIQKTDAPVTRAVLDSEAGKTDLGCAASTIAGAMMGFIPTVDGSLRRVLNEWLREGTFWSLRARLGDTKASDFTDACNRLGDAFIPAMQLRAVPELIWRTATVSHTMGECPHQVAVNPGDIVVAGAISATQQNLEEGRPDLHYAFGGNRRADGYPTHACPGADPALAVMIGFFSALVESPLPLRVGPGPLTLALDGRLPAPDEAFKSRIAATISPGQDHDFDLRAGTQRWQSSTATPLLAVGDSWLFDQWERDYGVGRGNLSKSLLKLGYKDIARGTSDFASAGRALSGMAQRSFLKDVTNYLADEPGIKAILFGGGGNDVVAGLPGQQPLYRMLQPLMAGEDPPKEPLNEAELADFIDVTLFKHYDTLIKTLTTHSKIPIIIHGYDHPIPDGRGDALLIARSGPWLQPFFEMRGYDVINNSRHLAVASGVMRRLIDGLNATVKKVADAYPNRVYYVKLTGTLAENYGDANKHTLLWANELHPNEQGYDLVAALIAKQLQDLGIG
jgi:lysophospholipase L1-like esterase